MIGRRIELNASHISDQLNEYCTMRVIRQTSSSSDQVAGCLLMAGFGGCGVGGWVAGVSLTLRKANNAKGGSK